MATGWARDGAVQEQIDATVEDAVRRARRNLANGPSRRECEECGAAIPEARRRAIQGVRYCVTCQSELDSRDRVAGINRRGSKDSQLR
jgi:phage/conjugal plasmid C-4 type zinc finger TraR family protein